MIKSLRRASCVLALLLAYSTNALAAVELADNYPQTYVVEKGDTLWDIAGKFLQKPWHWPEIWQKNQQIDNPHLIYPGDILRLVYIDGQPRIMLEAASTTIKLSPRVKTQPLKEAIPSISYKSVYALLKRVQVVTEEQLKNAPYVVASNDERPFYGGGDDIYVLDRFQQWQDHSGNDGVFRVGERYLDPDSGETLGYEAIETGRLSVMSAEKDMVRARIVSSSQEITAGDRVLVNAEQLRPASFFPAPPDHPVTGKIIRLFDAVSHAGRNDVVVIGAGKREGLVEGNVLAVQHPGRTVKDEHMKQWVTLPDEQVGVIFVFSVFDKVSYGLVMESTQPVSLGDKIANPD